MKNKDKIPHKRSLYFVKWILGIAINNLKDCAVTEWNLYYEELYKYLCDELESRWNR